MNYRTIKVRFQEPICFLQLFRPEANNAMNDLMIEECHHALDVYEEAASIIVLEGLPNDFCSGADFKGMHDQIVSGQQREHNPEPTYNLWLRLATGPYITVSHVRGKANAGGVGFVAASDIVLADETAQFSLSELLFGLFPACVLPFLIRRIGFQKANYMSLMTKPISAKQAQEWGLVDSCDSKSESLVRKHLLRLKKVPKNGIVRYKRYLSQIDDSIVKFKSLAIESNKEVFSDSCNLERICRFVDKGQL